MADPKPGQDCLCSELIKQAKDGDAYIIGPPRWHVSSKFSFCYTRIAKVSKQIEEAPEAIVVSRPGGPSIKIIKSEPQDAEPQKDKCVAPKEEDPRPKKKDRKKCRH